MKITACCIIKNEEKNLPTYINGVMAIADEIVIVDTGSTDNSVKILEELKIKYKLNLSIYNFEWINDFAAAKNFAISKANGDWIIFVDADEYFEEKNHKKIRKFLNKTFSKKGILGIICPYWDINKSTGIIMDRSFQSRIFRNDKDLKYTGAIHEHLTYKGSPDFNYTNADFPILHTGHSPEVAEEKTARNNKIILANKDLANENYPMYYAYLASALIKEGKLNEAEENAKLAVELIKKKDPSYLTDCYNIYFHVKKAQKTPPDEMYEIIEKALKDTSRNTDILAEKFSFVMDTEYLPFSELKELAIEILDKHKALESNKNKLKINEGYLPSLHFILGQIYKIEKNYEAAKSEFLATVKLQKYYKDALKEYLLLSNDSEENTIKILNKYYDLKSKNDEEFLSKVLETISGK